MAAKLVAGFTPEFMGRQDGNLGLRQQVWPENKPRRDQRRGDV